MYMCLPSYSAHLIEQPVSRGQDYAVNPSDIIVFDDVVSVALPLWEEEIEGAQLQIVLTTVGLHNSSIRPKVPTRAYIVWLLYTM